MVQYESMPLTVKDGNDIFINFINLMPFANIIDQTVAGIRIAISGRSKIILNFSAYWTIYDGAGYSSLILEKIAL